MISNLFSIPLFTYFIQDWDNKKQEFYHYIHNSDYRTQENGDFQTDRFSKRYNYAQDFQHVFSESFDEFKKEFGASKVNIKNIWTVKYSEKNQYHCPHNHSSTGFSGILYMDYDPEIHLPTTFMCPWNDPIDDVSLFTNLPHPAEGIIYIWPSFLVHHAESMKSDKKRVIVSWDMEVEM
jgi:hypothetical protein